MSKIRYLPGHVARLARQTRWQTLDLAAGTQRRVPTGHVALTFDDGPHPSSTPRVLDVLAELSAPATFFCVGRNASQFPGIVRRILDEGHGLGSHSSTHPHPAELTVRATAREYRDGQQVVSDIRGSRVPLFRPPHGHLRLVSALWLRHADLQPWLWTVDPEDWRPGRAAEDIVRVASGAEAGDVVLFHDWVEQPEAPEAMDRSATIAALPEVIRRIRRKGLTLVALIS